MITRIGEKKIFNITPIVASYTHHNTGIQYVCEKWRHSYIKTLR